MRFLAMCTDIHFWAATSIISNTCRIDLPNLDTSATIITSPYFPVYSKLSIDLSRHGVVSFVVLSSIINDAMF